MRALAARLPAVRLPALTIAPWALAAGAAASLVLRPPAPVALAAGGALGLALLAARQRPAAVAAVVAAAGLALGVVRLDALAADPLGGAVGRSIDATATVTGDWRGTPPRWGAEARLAPRGDRVFLRLVAARPPPRGAILAVSGDLRRPDPPRNGYDEAALLARRGIRVVLEAERWRPVGRRGGVAGVLDRIRRASVEAYGPAGHDDAGALLGGLVLGADEDLSRRGAGRLPRLRPGPPARGLGLERRAARGAGARAGVGRRAGPRAGGRADDPRDRGLRGRRRSLAVGGAGGRGGRRSRRRRGCSRGRWIAGTCTRSASRCCWRATRTTRSIRASS